MLLWDLEEIGLLVAGLFTLNLTVWAMFSAVRALAGSHLEVPEGLQSAGTDTHARVLMTLPE
jgi:hypothetical protein